MWRPHSPKRSDGSFLTGGIIIKKIIFVIGKTASGKDTVARILQYKHDIPAVVSYTTRPMRASEKDGREHFFVSKDRMEEICSNEHVLAYTRFPNTGYEYCATTESLKGDVNVYIIDPPGVEWFKSQNTLGGLDVEFKSIYVDLPEGQIRKRALSRGDGEEAVEARLTSEREIFDAFYEDNQYDYCISNTGTKEELEAKTDAIYHMIMRDFGENR